MNRYIVTLYERCVEFVEIKAENAIEAREKAEEMLNNDENLEFTEVDGRYVGNVNKIGGSINDDEENRVLLFS